MVWVMVFCVANSEFSAAATHNIRDYGAKGDGKTLDTAAIQSAITAAAADKDGGKVLIPAGTFHSGALRLKSDITLHLAKDAVLLGSRNLDDYRVSGGEKNGGRSWQSSLIRGEGVKNVTIKGEGTINGNKVRNPKGEEGQRGPHTVVFRDAEDITVRGIRTIDSGNYAYLLFSSKRCRFENLHVEGGWDGIHWREGEDFVVRNCRFYTGDDSLAGRGWHKTLIENCHINTSCNGIRVFADIHDLHVRHCVFEGPGKHPHITQSRHNMLAAIIFQPGAWRQKPSHSSKILFENLKIRNTMTGIHCSLREGNSLEDFVVRKVDAAGIYGSACSIESWGKPILKARIENYTASFTPDPKFQQTQKNWRPAGFGTRPLPAWAFYAKNVQGLTLRDVRWTRKTPTTAPATLFEDVSKLTTERIQVNGKPLKH